MRTFTKEIIEQTVVDTITCNKCGDVIPKWHDCVRTAHGFGYHSTLFGDNTEVYFDLCERCVFEFVKTFKVAAEING